MSNNFIDKNYKKWHNYAKIITNNKEADDLLHDVILILLVKYPDLTPVKWNDNFIFITLKNSFITRVTSKNNNMIDTNLDISFELESVINTNEWDIQQMIIDDDTTQKKLDCITNTILNLNQFERKLYQLHYIYGLSQRKIARSIGVSHLTINTRINKIKQKIKNNYDK